MRISKIWIDKGLIRKSKWYVRVINTTGNTVVIENRNGYKTKKEAEKRSKVLLGKTIYFSLGVCKIVSKKSCTNCGTTKGKMRLLKGMKERTYLCSICDGLLSAN